MFDERLKPPWQHSWVGGGLVDQSDAEVSEAKRRPEKAFAQLQGLRGFVRSLCDLFFFVFFSAGHRTRVAANTEEATVLWIYCQKFPGAGFATASHVLRG